MTLFVLAALALQTPIRDTSDLVGVWEGLSLCADKNEFPTVADEQVVYHVTAKDKRTILLMANKLVQGKEVPMSDKPLVFAFDSKTATLTGRIESAKPSVWTFHITFSTWVGTAKSTDGKVFRNILVKRRDQPKRG